MYWTDREHWADRGHGTIQRANLDGTRIETLITGLDQPLTMTIRDGYMYWITNHGRIQRADLQGNGVTTLVEADNEVAYGRGIAIY